MSRALTRDLAALLLTGLGLWLGSHDGGVCPRVVALAVATLASFGTSASWGLGLLALGLGLAAHPHASWPLEASPTLAGAGLAGAALGLLGRQLAAVSWHGPLSPGGLRGILLLSFPLLVLAEPSGSRLAGADGAPLVLSFVVTEPSGLEAVPLGRHLPIPDSLIGGDPVTASLPWLAGLAVFVAWLVFARPAEPQAGSPSPLRAAGGALLDQLAPRLTGAVALLMAVAAVTRVLTPLLAGAPVTLDPDQLRLELSLAAGPAGAVVSVSVPEAFVAPWSRPPLDALRLAVALALLASLASRPSSPLPELSTRHLALLALAGLTGCLMFGFMPEASAAALVLGLLSVIASLGQTDRPASRSPHLGLLATFVLLLLAVALAPLTPAPPLVP